jgi:hypothetical protein
MICRLDRIWKIIFKLVLAQKTVDSLLMCWALTRLQFRHGSSSDLLFLFHLKCALYVYLEGTLKSIHWPSPDALMAAAGWSSTEHLSLISWWVGAADVTGGPTTSRPTPMVVKKSFAFRVAVLANSIACYDQLLFARAVCRFCIFIYNVSSSWRRRWCRKVAERWAKLN